MIVYGASGCIAPNRVVPQKLNFKAFVPVITETKAFFILMKGEELWQRKSHTDFI
jgi:hypothetical protein